MKPQSPSFAAREETSLAGKRILFIGAANAEPTSHYVTALTKSGAEVIEPITKKHMLVELTPQEADDIIAKLSNMGKIDAVFMPLPIEKGESGSGSLVNIPAVRVTAKAHAQGIPTLIVDTAASPDTSDVLSEVQKIQLRSKDTTYSQGYKLMPCDAVKALAEIIAAKEKSAGRG